VYSVWVLDVREIFIIVILTPIEVTNLPQNVHKLQESANALQCFEIKNIQRKDYETGY
jgi:hypothetical protein